MHTQISTARGPALNCFTFTAKKLYRMISVTLHAIRSVTRFSPTEDPFQGKSSIPHDVTCAGAATRMPHTSHTRDATCKTASQMAQCELQPSNDPMIVKPASARCLLWPDFLWQSDHWQLNFAPQLEQSLVCFSSLGKACMYTCCHDRCPDHPKQAVHDLQAMAAIVACT